MRPTQSSYGVIARETLVDVRSTPEPPEIPWARLLVAMALWALGVWATWPQ